MPNSTEPKEQERCPVCGSPGETMGTVTRYFVSDHEKCLREARAAAFEEAAEFLMRYFDKMPEPSVDILSAKFQMINMAKAAREKLK